MICQSCGNQVTAEVRFCPHCGAQMEAAATPPAPDPRSDPQPGPPPGPAAWPPPVYPMRPPRVQNNLPMLGILWCVFGAYRAIGGLIGIFTVRLMSERHFSPYGWMGHSSHGPFGVPWMGTLIPFIAIVAAIMAALAFLVGFSLLARKPWGRILAIVAAILSLLKFPLGTALGIYTLWVLGPGQSAAEYDAIADHT